MTMLAHRTTTAGFALSGVHHATKLTTDLKSVVVNIRGTPAELSETAL